MRRLVTPFVAIAAILVAAAHPASAQSPRELIARAAQAMGGADALRQIRSVSVEFSQLQYALGQEETPYAPARATMVFGRAVFDHAGSRRLQVSETRPAFAGGANTKQRVVYASGVVVTENNGTAAPDLRGAALGAQQRLMRTQPEQLVLTALEHVAALTTAPSRNWRSETLRGVHFTAGPDTLDLYFDGGTGLLTLVVQMVDDAVLGDRANVTSYQRWYASGAVKLPRQIDITANDRPVQQITVHAAEVNAALADSLFTAPADVALKSSRTVMPPEAIALTLTDLTNGTWHLSGGNYNSLVVEQPAGLIVVEAPVSSARMRAVFDTLASRFPAKPVRLVVATHHHYDHSGGVREVLARNVPLIVHERNGTFFVSVGKMKKSIAPDRLSSGGRFAVQTLRDTMTIGTGAGRVQLFAMPSVHVAGLLAAYVPASQVLFTSDVVNPQPMPAALPPAGSKELVAFGEQRALTIKSYAGGHGRVVGWDELQRAARP